VLYIVRIGGRNKTEMTFCSPCSACYEQIKKLGIRKIVYVDKDGNLTHSKVNDLNITHISLGNRILGKT
jgi:deoxycytidylate deaminase